MMNHSESGSNSNSPIQSYAISPNQQVSSYKILLGYDFHSVKRLLSSLLSFISRLVLEMLMLESKILEVYIRYIFKRHEFHPLLIKRKDSIH